MIPHLLGLLTLGILQTTTLPFLLHLGLLLWIPSGETPASTESTDIEGIIAPAMRNNANTFFMINIKLIYDQIELSLQLQR